MNERKELRKRFYRLAHFLLICDSLTFNGILTLEVYLMPSPVYTYKLNIYKLLTNSLLVTIFGLVWFVWFYGISTFVGYLTPNPFLCK